MKRIIQAYFASIAFKWILSDKRMLEIILKKSAEEDRPVEDITADFSYAYARAFYRKYRE